MILEPKSIFPYNLQKPTLPLKGKGLLIAQVKKKKSVIEIPYDTRQIQRNYKEADLASACQHDALQYHLGVCTDQKGFLIVQW